MNSEMLKNVLEFGGGVAVLLGLVFVGLELRQNTAAVEAATFQDLTDASSDYILTIASDPELSRINLVGSVSVDELNELDSYRFNMVARSYWVRMQNVYSQWQRGTLNDEDWKMYESVICFSGDGINSNRGVIGRFDQHAVILTESFRDFVTACWNREAE